MPESDSVSLPAELSMESPEVFSQPGGVFPSPVIWAAVLGSGHSVLQQLGSWGGFRDHGPGPDAGKDQRLMVY